jgi:prolyl oligopeptidase
MKLKRRDLAAWPLGWSLPASTAWADSQDPHAWLEDVESVRALEWVNARNAEALALVQAEPQFERRHRETLETLNSLPANIQHVSRHGEYLYNFYRNSRQPHGVWRRTTLDEYTKDRPSWQVLIKFDDLAREEGRNIVFTHASINAATGRALIFLSSAGEDKSEFREFDIESRSFVLGGFQAPTAKLWASWFGPDELLVATDTGPGSVTSSGYPQAIRRWKRGAPLIDSPVVLRGLASDVQVTPSSGRREGLPPVALLERRIRFFEWERHLLRADAPVVRLDLPADAGAWLDRDWLVISLRSAWTVGARQFPQGSVLATPLAQAAQAERELHLLLEGRPRRRLSRIEMVKDGFVIASTEDLRPRLAFARWDGKAFVHAALPAPEVGMVSIATDRPAVDNRFWLTSQAPVTPQSLSLLDAGAATVQSKPIRVQASAFDAAGLRTRQFEVRSTDGTLVPYTVVGPAQPSGDAPTLLYGYGGFGIPVELDYQRMPGINWLQYGGTFVIAHIRGGGEFGTEWYLAAKGARRQTAFDDFMAVAQDLVARGITQPKRLGIYGASNGGALVSAVMVQRPELFGAVVSRVPLTDMIGFPKLFAGRSWIEEYGDPDVPADRAVLERWSPYSNVKSAASGVSYPAVLFIGNRNDDRVHPAHARKMVAQLRALGHSRTWLYEEMTGGHSGRSDPRIFALREAMIYSFLFRQLVPRTA